MATFYQPNAGMQRKVLRAGDILINTSTFKPAHCGILYDQYYVIHATSKGIKKDPIEEWSEEADMFRANPELTDQQAESVVKIAEEIKTSAEYGKTRAVFKSTFASGKAGEGLMARLAKYNERLQDHQGMVKNVYCSELVILCYQMAWYQEMEAKTNARLFINLDGKHTWPSTLRRYLRSNPNFKELGLFKKQPNA